MKSPFADCDAKLKKEPAVATFRGEQYQYTHSYYECEKTKERFTTGELDEKNVSQIYNQYREKYNIPSPSEIEVLLQRYDISIAKLTTIVGFGDNQISRYIKGEIPNRANGTTLSVLRNVDVFEQYVDNAKKLLGDKTYKKIKQTISEERTRCCASVAGQVAEPEVVYGVNNDSLKIETIKVLMDINDINALLSIKSFIEAFS